VEGGFDSSGRFVHLPRLARNMLQWDHSGFSADVSVRFPAGSSRAREPQSQTIARPPVSLSKRIVEEHAATFLYHTACNPYFRNNRKVFRATDFVAELLQQLPDPRRRLIRRYGLYSSRSRGTCPRASSWQAS
jgi:hypothetical protein